MKSENRESFGVESDADSSSMNRSDTMGGSGGGGRGTFARAWTQTVGFGNLARGITEGWQKNYDSEDAWTRRLMEEVHVVSKKGTEGDIPAPDGFAKEASFWRILGMSAFFGAILGFCALFFLICAEKIPKEWVHNSDMKSFSDIDFYAGKTYYIIITGGTGLLVGLLRYVSKYPETVPGIFKEINECHVSPKTAPYTVLFSAMSLAGGASLGPEQALGSLGGGLATWLVENHVEFPVESDRKMVVLCGMCAAFGALFPTPVLGVLLLYELGQPPKSFMESILTLSVGAVVAFAIYYRFAENMYLERLTSTGGVLSVGWNFELENCVTGLIIGIVSAGLCVVNVLMIGVFRQVFNRIRDRMDQRGLPGTIIAPLIGGIAVGSISYVLPLTIGDGNMTLAPIIRQTYDQVTSMNDGVTLDEPYITAHLLICSLFAKMFCIGVSMNCGFVGGFVFPLITVGAMAGAAGSLLNPHQPIGLFIGAFMAAVPAGICPMPFTLLCISVFCLYFGLYQTVPLFVAVLTSYLLVCGSGLFRALADRGETAAAERARQQQQQQQAKDEQGNDADTGSATTVSDSRSTGAGTGNGTTTNPLRNDSTSTDYDPRGYGTSQFMRPTGHIPAPRVSDLEREEEGLTVI